MNNTINLDLFEMGRVKTSVTQMIRLQVNLTFDNTIAMHLTKMTKMN